MSRRRRGLDLFSTPEHKTRILPLRWIANSLNGPATKCLTKAVGMDEDRLYGWKFNLYLIGWKFLNLPYERWGTTYKVDLEEWKKDMDFDNKSWDDYDENGIAYWEKTGTVDPDYYGDKNVK